MGFLSPLFLLAGLAALVPIFLHLFQRHETRRMAFPALRYLKRTEKEHAKRIRIRQLLLLLLRVGAITLLVAAGARAFLSGPGRAHPPTALALVLDNSASSGLVLENERVLEQLKRGALASVAAATDRDEIWVLRAGEPWDVAVPGPPAAAEARIRDTEPRETSGNLNETLRRAVALVQSSELANKEVHLFSDLQASGFPDSVPTAVSDAVPILALRPDWDVPTNHGIGAVLIGGGLPPVVGQQSQVAAELIGPSSAAGDSVAARLFVNGRIVGATVAPLGSTVVFPLGPLPEGTVEGHVEIDPDPLRTDDRRHFAFRSRRPPRVQVTGPGSAFLESAIDVLQESGRARVGSPGDVLFALDGEGLSQARPGVTRVVFPAGDPATLPALNRRLAAAGIPWSYRPASTPGEMRITRNELPHDLSEIRVRGRFDLAPEPSVRDRALVEVGVALPWIVSGQSDGGRYLLFGSPLNLESSNLVVSSVLLPLLEWTVGRWSAAEDWTQNVTVGEAIELPPGTTAIADPSGAIVTGDPEAITRSSGIYSVTAGGSVVGRVAANVALGESELARIGPIELGGIVGAGFRMIDRPSEWGAAIFRARQGPEIWWPLVAAGLVLLLLESLVAGTGRHGGSRRSRSNETDAEGIRATAAADAERRPAATRATS